MGFIKEFKDFAMRGNVVDMAVGIIIGGAFGKIVSSFVSDVIMPPIGVLLGGMDFSQLSIKLKDAVMNEAGEVVTEQPVRIFSAQEQDLSIRAVRTSLPLPDKPFNTLRLMHQGAEIGRYSFQQTELAASQALSAENQDETLTLSWGDIQTPALVRYSSDGGATWTTLGVDVTGGKFSYGLADLPTAPLKFQVLLADGAGSLSLDFPG